MLLLDAVLSAEDVDTLCAATSTRSAGDTPASAICSALKAGGSSPQPSCSAIEYACCCGTVRQLSIEPVGQGEMQAMHRLQMAASTT